MRRVGLLATAILVLTAAALVTWRVQRSMATRPAAMSSGPRLSLPETPVSEFSLLGPDVTRITDGDFLHPAFSPDGRKLAYSRVVVKEGTEWTEVLVRDLASNHVVSLLDAEASKKYAVYKSFVFGLRWTGDNTLEAEIGDGDVGSTRVVFDTAARKVLSETYSQADEEGFTMTAEEQARLEKAAAGFPDWQGPALEGALRGGIPVGKNVFIVQKSYAGEDAHIWRLDLERREARRLLVLPPRGYQKSGGFTCGDTVVPLLAGKEEKKAWLLALRGERWARLAEIERRSYAALHVKHRSPAAVWFQVRTSASYERGHTPLFVFDARGVRRASDVAELYDAALDLAGRRICLVAWEGSERHLLLGDLN